VIYRWSIPLGWVSVLWIIFIVTVLCLPPEYPITAANMNMSGPVLLLVLGGALLWWALDARHWFKGPVALVMWVEVSWAWGGGLRPMGGGLGLEDGKRGLAAGGVGCWG
jgi:hypothetical protein